MSPVVLQRFLSEEEVQGILALIPGALIDDEAGKTADIFGNLQRRKRRKLLPGTNAEGEEVARLTAQAMKRNFSFQHAAYPQSFSRPRLCSYGPGMDYRDHLDIPLIGKTQLRTDLSVTICLTGSDSYDGGELVIDSDSFERRWKGNAGDCILYPSDSIHRVDPVTRGERVVIIFWVQSLVRDERKRSILFDLATGFDPLEPTTSESSRAAIMRQSHASLLRIWAEK